MDKLDYKYIPNTNKLNHVTDAVTASTPADYRDIKNQSPDNYAYDSIGNLIRDNQEGISKIKWTAYGKIQRISKANGTIIKYAYDPGGNRISKIVTTTTPAISGDSTYYVRDASGNVMSVYNKKSEHKLLQTELPIYGSSRLGVYHVSVDVQDCPAAVPAAITIFIRGNKFFELSNHLGNVLATVTDRKIQHTTDGSRVDYYTADVNNATDYYPFGMQMPGRNGHVESSRDSTPRTTINSTAVADLVVANRSSNKPSVYEATNSITFIPDFTSTTGDIFEARILEVSDSSADGAWVSGVGSYRYGFNGKENDNEIKGEGNQQDYGMRINDPRLGKFLSVDPITKKFPMLTPYQFASNVPIWAIDLDGLEARVYNDVSVPIGHTFLSVLDKDGIINVYTYGQYGEGKENSKQGPIGQGVLIHFKGNAANEYIKHEFKNNSGNINVYEISNKVVDKQAIIDHYSNQMKDGTPATSNKYEVKLAKDNASTGSEAVKYKIYSGLPDGKVTENCSSATLDALKAGSSSVLPSTSTPIPQDVNLNLWILSKVSGNYNDVTKDAKIKAESNTNGTKAELKK